MQTQARLKIQKTYKIFVDGKFPRTESGRYFSFQSRSGEMTANVSLCSRKDLRDAVTAARGAQPKWAGATATNRGQILYRMAEMLETRRAAFREELVWQGQTPEQAESEVSASVDRLVHYAGWADKYQQIFSSVNPVASKHFNFSVLEPVGVVGLLAPEKYPLLGLISLMAPVLVGGNTCVVLGSESNPLSAISFTEVLGTSDVPAGVINVLTGKRSELLPHFATHMEINALVLADGTPEEWLKIEQEAAHTVRRSAHYQFADWSVPQAQSPYFILDCQELKTTWHPIGL